MRPMREEGPILKGSNLASLLIVSIGEKRGVGDVRVRDWGGEGKKINRGG